MKKILDYSFVFLVLVSGVGCKKKTIHTGNDPNFTIISNSDEGFEKANRKVMVFGIPIYAYKQVDDAKLLHAANVMAQYLDNDEDGVVDNELVLSSLLENDAALFMWKRKTQVNLPAQDLGDDETNPEWHTNEHAGRFDATLEEVWHVITHKGYANAYPNVFGEGAGTSLSNAMDSARGGNFIEVPSMYPQNAWYTYDDKTCEYDCMTTEYIYWAMLSILGAHEKRLDEISHEWKLNSHELVEEKDTLVYQLLTDPQYSFPTVLPDGTYRH